MISALRHRLRKTLHKATLLLATTALCACSQEREGLVLLIPGGAMKEATAEAVAAFQKDHPGVKVEVVTTPGRDYYVKSLTMLAGRAQVDLLWMGQGFGIFAGRGALLNLDPLIAADPSFSLGRYQQDAVGWYRYEGKLYGIPYGIDLLGIAYNRDLFASAGIPEPKADWNLDDLIHTAKQLTQRDPHTGRTRVAGLGFLELDLRSHGLTLLDADHTRFALNTPRGLAWLEENVHLIQNERLLQRGGSIETMNRLESFINGQVAMIEFAPWDLTEMQRRALFRWDVVGIPFGRDGQRTAWASSSGFCIPRNSRHPELAWDLLKRLTSETFQRKLLHTTMPAMSDISPAFLAANPQPSRLREMLELQDRMQPNARIPLFQEVDAEWTYWKDQALLGKLPAAKALEEAESHINRILRLQREGKKQP